MTMQDGQFDLGPMTDTSPLKVPAGAVPIPGDLAARWGWTDPSQEWRNLAMSPRFAAQRRRSPPRCGRRRPVRPSTA